MEPLLERWTDRASADALPDWLATLLSHGLVEEDDCLLLADSASADHHPARGGFSDATGYEAFVNHLHVDPVDDSFDDVFIALTAAKILVAELHRWRAGGATRMIVSRNLGGEFACSTVLFHRIRPGEMWLSGDLEGYRHEAIGYCNIG